MKHKISIILTLLLFVVPANGTADELIIKLADEPTPKIISLDIEFKFDQETTIYHWQSGKTIYPILNLGLYIECEQLNKNREIKFMPYEKVVPKLGHELDVLEVTNYRENLRIVPGENYQHTVLEKGRYSLTLVYDTKEHRRYLTPKNIRSNEITFEIK